MSSEQQPDVHRASKGIDNGQATNLKVLQPEGAGFESPC